MKLIPFSIQYCMNVNYLKTKESNQIELDIGSSLIGLQLWSLDHESETLYSTIIVD